MEEDVVYLVTKVNMVVTISRSQMNLYLDMANVALMVTHSTYGNYNKSMSLHE